MQRVPFDFSLASSYTIDRAKLKKSSSIFNINYRTDKNILSWHNMQLIKASGNFFNFFSSQWGPPI